MAHTYALSVSQNNICKEKWVEQLLNSGIRNYEYSCGAFPGKAAMEKSIAVHADNLKAGKYAFTSLHLPFYWGAECPAQPDDFERNICASRLGRVIEVFSPVGMKHLTFHPGSGVEGQSRESALACVRKTVEYLIPYAEKCGASLNIEVLPRGSVGGVPEEMEQLLEGMPDCVGICFDVNHACPRSEEVPEWIARLGKRIRSFHISDCDNIDECHWFPGWGMLDWKAIMREINRLDHDCLLIYEVAADGFMPPAFENREMDPVWFFEFVKKSMAYLQSL